ncbi:MAG TPA: hypothetical protein VHD90_21425, partial [Phototrophicaceae bacterium]|nr:hypothetical protein [Phototrophicaceae bacterium]
MLKAKKAPSLVDVMQPLIADLVRGAIELFSINMQINIASAARYRVDLKIARAWKTEQKDDRPQVQQAFVRRRRRS